MSFIAKLRSARELLQAEKRQSLRALGRELGLEADELNDLVDELVTAQRVATLDDKVLVWARHKADAPDARPDAATRTD